jgi:Flp pilus assembly protein CpaB
VLAVNRSTDSRRPAAIRQLTLAVTSEQARAIEAARQRGALTALLRNSRDMPQPAARVVSTPEPTPEPTPVGAARPASRDIEIILGTQTLSTQEPGGAAEVRR